MKKVNDVNNLPQLPTLPYGEGSYSYRKDGSVMLRKTYKGKRLCTYGATAYEALKRMKERQKKFDIEEKKNDVDNNTLIIDMEYWLKHVKQVELSAASYDRLETTIRNQINQFTIANMPTRMIEDQDITRHIEDIVTKGYSFSVIKKTYEAFAAFFRWKFIRNSVENPMLTVTKPSKKSLFPDDDLDMEYKYLNENEIRDFIHEALRTYGNGKLVHKMGYGYVSLIYTGLRVSEARALRWRNIDFEERILYVNEQVGRYIDRSIPLDANGSRTYKTVLKKPKTKGSIRKVLLCDAAVETLKKFKELQNPKSQDDFVFCAKGKDTAISESVVNKSIHSIQMNACLYVQGVHSLRHTCCSLLCRAGVDEWQCAKILGHNDTNMIHEIYRHMSMTEHIVVRDKFDTYLNVHIPLDINIF